jgi:MoxR-like ATPase
VNTSAVEDLLVPDDSLPARFGLLESVLNGELVERSADIRCALLALVAGKTFFMVGEAGIAKSLLARRIHVYVEGGEFFDGDLDRFSKPEDVFGPQSLSALREDRWERNVEGTLVTADWAMLDEFFEASSAMLKAMLRALNEREFRNGTAVVKMPLTTLFCASNEVPTEARLMPLYDRLLIRRKLRRIQEPGSFVEMLELERPECPEPILTWSEVLKAQAEAATVVVPNKVLCAVAEIRRALADKAIEPSDRRFFEAMGVVRAAAWLDDCEQAEPAHLAVLSEICWNHPSQIPDVLTAVDSVLEPLITQVDRLMQNVMAIKGQIRKGLPDLDRKRLAIELHDKLKQAIKEMEVLQRGVRDPRQLAKLRQTEALISAVSEQILTDLYERNAPEAR